MPEPLRLPARKSARTIADFIGIANAADCWDSSSMSPGVAAFLRGTSDVSISAAGLTVEGEELGVPGGITGAFARAEAESRWRYAAGGVRHVASGSTTANHLAMSAFAATGCTTAVVARNCHHSILHGLAAAGLEFEFIEHTYLAEHETIPPPDPVQLERALASGAGADLVVVTSPTYEGVHADIAALARVAHRHGALLFVDAAWGAAACLHPNLPPSPLAQDADVMVTSFHKTLGALQPAAMVAWRNDRQFGDAVRLAADKRLAPSESLLVYASIELATADVAAGDCALLDGTFATIAEVKRAVGKALPGLRPLTPESLPAGTVLDPGRVVLDCSLYGVNGYEIRDALGRRGIVVEKAGARTITLLAPLVPRKGAVGRLVAALPAILSGRAPVAAARRLADPFDELVTKPVVSAHAMRTRWRRGIERVRLEDAYWRVAAELVELYPPGIPIVPPGFRFTHAAIAALSEAAAQGGTVATPGGFDGTVAVLSREAGREES